jgi:hypothetical protein
VYCLMNGFTHNGLVRNRFGHPSFPRKRESRDSSSNGSLVHGEAPLGPRLRGDDELSSKLFARHYTSRPSKDGLGVPGDIIRAGGRSMQTIRGTRRLAGGAGEEAGGIGTPDGDDGRVHCERVPVARSFRP